MTISWDREEDRIWFGTWTEHSSGRRLYLIVERLPKATGWDWAVWQRDGAKIVRRGIERSASDAAEAAEITAIRWRGIG